MLLYGPRQLIGYDLSIEELKRFRQLPSRTRGHPECGLPPASKPPPARSGSVRQAGDGGGLAPRAGVGGPTSPAVLLLSWQNLPQHGDGAARATLIAKGAYVLSDTDGTPDVVLIATGSEVGITTGAHDLLAQRNV